jgi:hypothetical protein
MNTLQRISMCLLVLALVFGGWYIADPQFALLQAPDAEKGPRALNRLVVYVTYIMSVVVTWISTAPTKKSPYPPLMP